MPLHRQVPSSNSEGGLSIYGADSGYHFGIINGTRLCASYWPADCLNSMTGDYLQDRVYVSPTAVLKVLLSQSTVHTQTKAV